MLGRVTAGKHVKAEKAIDAETVPPWRDRGVNRSVPGE